MSGGLGVDRVRRGPPRALLALGVGALAFTAVCAAIALHDASSPSSPQSISGATGSPAGPSAPGFTRVERAAPPFSLPALGGGARVSPAAASGPVLVNFWASNCAPCREEMPLLAAAARALDGKVGVVGVDTGDLAGRALAFARAHGAAYPIGFDPDETVGDRYGLAALPTTYFLSADHREILGIYFGAMDRAGLDAALRVLYHTILPAPLGASRDGG